MEQVLCAKPLWFLQCPAWLWLKLFNLSLIWLLGHFGDSAQTSKNPLKENQGRMFPAIYNINFSVFSIRDFDNQLATVNCSSNDDLTNSFILAIPLIAASDWIYYLMTRHIIPKPKGVIFLIFKIKEKVSNELNLIFRCFSF